MSLQLRISIYIKEECINKIKITLIKKRIYTHNYNFFQFEVGLNLLIKACLFLRFKNALKKLNFFYFFSLIQINIFLCLFIFFM